MANSSRTRALPTKTKYFIRGMAVSLAISARSVAGRFVAGGKGRDAEAGPGRPFGATPSGRERTAAIHYAKQLRSFLEPILHPAERLNARCCRLLTLIQCSHRSPRCSREREGTPQPAATS